MVGEAQPFLLRKRCLSVQDGRIARAACFDVLAAALSAEVERVGEAHVYPGAVGIAVLLSVVLIMDMVEVEPATFVVLEHSPCTHLGIESFVAVGGADAIVGAYLVVDVGKSVLV